MFYNQFIKKTSPKVTITGGEPLLQEDGINCIIELCIKDNIPVTIETNGSIRPKKKFKHHNIRYIVDYKLPSSGMEEHMNMKWMGELANNDFIKFVLGDYQDYKRARTLIQTIFNNHKNLAF